MDTGMYYQYVCQVCGFTDYSTELEIERLGPDADRCPHCNTLMQTNIIDIDTYCEACNDYN